MFNLGINTEQKKRVKKTLHSQLLTFNSQLLKVVAYDI